MHVEDDDTEKANKYFYRHLASGEKVEDDKLANLEVLRVHYHRAKSVCLRKAE